MSTATPPTIRLAHVSDVHVAVPHARWHWRDWLSKRVTGWMNLHWGGRGKRFQEVRRVLEALRAELLERPVDHIIFSGDATALGFREEVEQAAEALGVGNERLPPGLAVPGNHDYYIPCAAASGHFERAFAAWQLGQRIGEFRYPFAQRVGPLWLVAVNSAIPHRWPTDASGSVGREQRERLRQLLNSLGPGPRILVTHYPIAQFNDQPQRPSHGLRDLAEILTIADAGGIALWLHGHDHRNYLLDDRRLAPFPIINAGSTTQLGTWGYNIYSITGWTLKSDRREFDSDLRAFRDGPGCEVALRHAP